MNTKTVSPARRIVLAALFLALAFVLPMVTGHVPQVGNMLCPMHFPILLCGFVLGGPWGLAVGFVAPLLRSVLFGMPPMFPIAVSMAFELAAYGLVSGLVWRKDQSGDFEAEHSRMIKSGNRYLRYYLLEAANSVRRCDSEFRRYYDLKFKEVNKYQHKRALALTARKLVRLVFRLLKDNRLYIPPEG